MAVQMLCGVVLARKFAQYEPLARLIALKYPSLESLARSMVLSEGCFFMVHTALWHSLRSVVRRGVLQGLDLWEGREKGVSFSKRVVRALSEEENQSSSWDGDGRGGEGGVR